MRIELDQLILGEGTAVTRGSGGVVHDKYAAIWYENGFVWVQPRKTGERLRFYHPAHCEMYPKPGQSAVPAMPGSEETKLAAVGGKR